MSLKIKILIGVLAFCSLLAYIYLVNKWNSEMIVPTSEHSHSHRSHSVNESAAREVKLSFLKNRDSILSEVKYPILIYRYSRDNCSNCIVEDLSELNIFQEEAGKDKVLVLPSFEESPNNSRMFANQLANFAYKNMSANLLIFPKDKNGFAYRYFALIDGKGNLGEIHFPQIRHTDVTKAYFGRVKGYFNSVQQPTTEIKF